MSLMIRWDNHWDCVMNKRHSGLKKIAEKFAEIFASGFTKVNVVRHEWMVELNRISISLAWFKPWLHHQWCILAESCVFSVRWKHVPKPGGLVWPNMLISKLSGKPLGHYYCLVYPLSPSTPSYNFTPDPCSSTNPSIDIKRWGIIRTSRPSCNFLLSNHYVPEIDLSTAK